MTAVVCSPSPRQVTVALIIAANTVAAAATVKQIVYLYDKIYIELLK